MWTFVLGSAFAHMGSSLSAIPNLNGKAIAILLLSSASVGCLTAFAFWDKTVSEADKADDAKKDETIQSV